VRASTGMPEENYAGGRDVLRVYRPFLPPNFPRDSALSRMTAEADSRSSAGTLAPDKTEDQDPERDAIRHLFDLAKRLRAAWDEPNLRKRERLIFEFHRQYRVGLNPSAQEWPEQTLFDDVMDHFRMVATQARAKYCGNPDCPNPYFIAAKRSYKYCSPDCSGPSQKKFKREWWAAHGPGWRQRREAKLGRHRKKKGAAR
jgi:hypothetical protein